MLYLRNDVIIVHNALVVMCHLTRVYDHTQSMLMFGCLPVVEKLQAQYSDVESIANCTRHLISQMTAFTDDGIKRLLIEMKRRHK